MATNKDTLFDKTLNGSFWNAGVTFERTNPVPLEKYSIFRTLADAQDYAKNNAVSYLGQIITVIGGEQTYSAWTFSDGETHTAEWNGTKWTIDGTPCTDAKQLPESLSITTGSITATRSITTPYDVANYKIVDTNGTLVQIDAVEIDPSRIQKASKEQYGVVKVGEGLDVADGVISAQKLDVDQVIDKTTAGSSNPVATSAVYEFTKAVSAETLGQAEDYADALSAAVQDAFIPLSVANTPTSSDKLTKVSEVREMINALDVATVELAPSKTIQSIGEEDGKISVVIQDIAISKGQVDGLTSTIDALERTDAKLREDVDTLSTDLSTTDIDLTAVKNRVKAIEDDYLTSTDKTELEGEITTAVGAEKTRAEGVEDFLSGKIDEKLAKAEFEKLSNDIGLSAASPTNQVATKNDIADLAGAMHFRGITTSELATGSKIIPEGTGYYDEGAGKVPTAGDVIVNATTAKEFVWTGAKYGIDGSDGKWVELGDEQLYLTKAAASELSTTLKGKIDTEETRAKGAESFLSGKIDTVSVDLDTLETNFSTFKSSAELSATNLCAEIKNVADNYLDKVTAKTLSDYLSDAIDAETTRATGAESFLSTAIDQKIYVDGQKTQALSISHYNADDYHQKVIDGTVLSNELYIVSGDFINAYGEQIKNLAEPTELSDATTKKYVDDKVVEAKDDVAALELSVQQLSTYTHALSVSQLVWDIDTINCGNAS